MRGPGFAAMRQTREQLEHIRREARDQMLAALTPQHRELLAGIVGRLALSTDPDRRAAAQQLDAALSPAESQAILAAAEHMRAAMRTTMEAARAQFEASMPADQRAGMQQHWAGRAGGGPGGRPGHTPDAGRALLRAALAFGGPEHGPDGGGPPPQR